MEWGENMWEKSYPRNGDGRLRIRKKENLYT